MGFLGSIGKAFKSVATVASPLAALGTQAVLNKVTGGMAGGFAGGSLVGGGAYDIGNYGIQPYSPQPTQLPVPIPRPFPMPRPLPRVPPGRAPQPLPMPPFPSPPAPRTPGGGVPMPIPIPFGTSIARTYCSQIRQSYYQSTGHRMPSMGKIKGLIRMCGMDQAAAAVGLDLQTMCRFLLLCKPRKKPLVRRSDLKACRRVTHSLTRLQHLVASLRVGRGSPIRGRRRRCPVCRKKPCEC